MIYNSHSKDREETREEMISLYKSHLPALRELCSTDPVAAGILTFLFEHCDKRGTVSCTSKVLQEVSGKGRTTVYKAVKKLKDKSFIRTLSAGAYKIYVLNPRVIDFEIKNSMNHQILAFPETLKADSPLLKKIETSKIDFLDIDE